MFKAPIPFLATIVALLISCQSTNAQAIEQMENSILALIDSIEKAPTFEQKESLNSKLILFMDSTLAMETSFDFAFEKLTKISILTSPDRKLRIYTWNIPQPNRTQKYYGYIQTLTNRGLHVFRLNDNRYRIKTPQMDILSADSWYGALYYSIRLDNFMGREVYTLLGIDMNNPFSSKRIIETVTFSPTCEPQFGVPLFVVRGTALSRIILEYSSRATLTLEWNEPLKMIIFDHLSPIRNDYIGNFQFYVPDFSYDGFLLTPNGWEYRADIDIRNPERTPNAPAKPPIENVDPGFLYRAQ